MKGRTNLLALFLCFCMLILMIVKSDIVISGARSGIELCIHTILPSLFPFILIATIFTSAASGADYPFLKPLKKICGIPNGAETIFILGILGGYPAGAQAIAESYNTGRLNKKDAEHMLCFCNNAGPAFIFGVLGPILNNIRLCILIWAIHICSALITSIMFHHRTSSSFLKVKSSTSIVVSLEKTVKTMAKICGWVTVFRIIIAFASYYFDNFLSSEAFALMCGILELSNGILFLSDLPHFTVFLIASFMLSFGGICIWMQTASIIKPLKMRNFCIGKCMQSIISVAMCLILAPINFSISFLLPLIGGVILIFIMLICEKSSSILKLCRV